MRHSRSALERIVGTARGNENDNRFLVRADCRIVAVCRDPDRQVGGERFDNRNPREWLGAQAGFRRRANAAQLNGFEAFPLFAAAVLTAHALQAPQSRLDMLAVTFVVARVLYLAFYLADQSLLRSLAWFVASAAPWRYSSPRLTRSAHGKVVASAA
jgi:uncharacterized MAPEG superfamily protein